MAYESLQTKIESNKRSRLKKRSKQKSMKFKNQATPGYKRLKPIEMNHEFKLSIAQLNQKKYFFITDGFGNNFRNYFEDVLEQKEILHVSKLKVIDDIEGCYYEGQNGVPAFILAPRQFTLNNSEAQAKVEEKALNSLISKLKDKSRGVSRQAVCDKYIILGSTALRGSPGIGFSDVKTNCECDYNTIVKMGARAHHTAENLLPFEVMDAFNKTREEFAIPGMQKIATNKKHPPKAKSMIWPSVAASYDYASSAHDDNDFFYQC